MTSKNNENVEQNPKPKQFHSDLLLLEPNLDKHVKFTFKKRYIAYSILTIVIFATSLTVVGFLQSEMIDLYIENQNVTIEQYTNFCNILDFSNINLIAHPFSLLLILVYMFLFWRRSCCLKCFCARPAPPMIVHPFKKNNRFFTAAIYGAISYEVVEIVYNAITKSSASDIWSPYVYDPSGLFKLTIRLIEVFLAALRYYPPLIAFCADSIVIYITAAVYMMVDISNNMYTEGRCDGFDGDGDLELLEKIKNSKVAYTLVKDVPQFFLLSLITSVLIVRSVLKIIEMVKSPKQQILINEDTKFYSIHDLKYCLNLCNKKDENVKKSFFKRFIYDWEPNFRFSSRMINTHVVAMIALFYFFIDWLYFGIIYMQVLVGSADGSLTELLDVFGDLNIKITFEKNILIAEHHVAGFVVATVLSYSICILQVFLGMRSIQQTLLKLYKGNKQDVAFLQSNASVCNGNTHYAGFLVGFLINGFLFIFAFLFLIVLVIYFLTQFSSWDKISPTLLKFVPILVVFIVKYIFNFVCSRFIFLQQRSKVLALDNFRAYSIFVYITFFFDCFIGAINALIRLIIGILGSLFFMPRVGYSFLGRQIEKFDGGFRVSTGYYQMEYSHSHPVMLTFCALLYYKRFLNRIDEHNSRDIIHLVRNRRQTKTNQVASNEVIIVKEVEELKSNSVDSNKNMENDKKLSKNSGRNQRVVNKWLLMITLLNNNNLIFYRKKAYSFRKFMILKDYSPVENNKMIHKL